MSTVELLCWQFLFVLSHRKMAAPGGKTDILSSLPPELLIRVMEHVDEPRKMRAVCRTWRQFFNGGHDLGMYSFDLSSTQSPY